MDKNKKRNDMREEILKVVMNHMEKAETAFKITDELCVLLGVSKCNPLPPQPPKDREIHISGKSRHKRY